MVAADLSVIAASCGLCVTRPMDFVRRIWLGRDAAWGVVVN